MNFTFEIKFNFAAWLSRVNGKEQFLEEHKDKFSRMVD